MRVDVVLLRRRNGMELMEALQNAPVVSGS